jgi:hypothetical protein
VTPSSTQERGVWRECQSQHNRKYNWSKHVMFGSVKRQKDANDPRRVDLKNKRLSVVSTCCWAGIAEPKILQRVFNY